MMMKIIDLLRLFLSSPSIIYVFLRYLTYILQFVNVILLVRILGDYEYGIYCFALLIMQYMSYTNLGLSDSLNTEYAANKNHKDVIKQIWNTTWSINIIINVVIVMICIPILYIVRPFEEYLFSDYSILLLMTCVLYNLLKVYITYNRLLGRLTKLNIQQLLPHLIILLSLLLIREKLNTIVLLWLTFVAYFISLIVFRVNLYEPPKFQINKAYAYTLIKRGIYLQAYNFSFYLMTLVASSLVSKFFSVQEFGCYSFANTMVNGVAMAGGAFMFIVYPKIINRLACFSDEASLNLIQRIRSIYVVFMDTLSLLAVVVSLLFPFILPQYKDELPIIFSLLIVAQICNNATSGYAALIIARKKEMYLVRFALLSVLLTLVFSTVLLHFFNHNLIVPGVLCISSLVYAAQVIKYGLNLLNMNQTNIWREFFVFKKWLLLILIPLNAFVFSSVYLLFFILTTYVILNYTNIRGAIKNGLFLFSNKDVLKF